MPETQGGKANKSGKILEQQVTNALSFGFQTIEYKTWLPYPCLIGVGLICNAIHLHLCSRRSVGWSCKGKSF